MKVNMTPNPLDVVTIHASQGDTEARQWEFELHNNGELIDTSEITEQLFFKAYKGGTEQILPENTSTPTTSPFKGDIRYPQGLLTDQEFTYRQSPTESDGLAKITDIKGNTLVWNQLLPTNWGSSGSGSGVTFTNNGDGSYTFNGTSTETKFIPRPVVVSAKANHKYLVNVGNDSNTGLNITINGLAEGSYVKTKAIISSSIDNIFLMFYQSGAVFNNLKVWPQVIDLSAMFGLGNEPSTVEEFTSLFPLPYYAYNQGSLLSFNGNGIKTVGKNLFDFSQFANGTITFENGDLKGTAGQFYSAVGIDLVYPKNTQITISFDARTEQNQASAGGGVYLMSNENGTPVQLATTANSTTAIQHITVTIPSNRHIDKLGWSYGTGGQNVWHITNFQVEFGATETSYEPYTSSTLSLPISTYFPSGMKDVPDYTNGGKIYDEMISNRADTRVGSVDLGTLDWTLSSPASHIFRGKLTDTNAKIPNASDLPNALLANYQPKAYNPISANDNGYFAIGYRSYDDVDVIVIIDSNYSTQDSFISHISGQYLYYELATPIETSFTTASLVTENAEIPLSNEDGILIGKCTEELSAEPGFHDAKIKLSDGDGDVYSNKLQLHVERSPQ